MQRVKLSDITTKHFLCIPGLPTVRIKVLDVAVSEDGVYSIDTSHGQLSNKDPDEQLWATLSQ